MAKTSGGLRNKTTPVARNPETGIKSKKEVNISGKNKISTASSAENLEKQINSYFFSTTNRIENGELFNARGKNTNAVIFKDKGRYYFYYG